MGVFLARRLIGMLMVLFSAVSITFILIRLTPGGPFDRERKLAPQIEEALLKKYRLDGTEGKNLGRNLAKRVGLGEKKQETLGEVFSLAQQYGEYLWDLVRGDLRQSTKYRNRSVAELLAMGLPVTAVLGAVALVAAVSLGLTSGILAVLWRNRLTDVTFATKTLLLVSVPTFVTGPLFVLVLALQLRWFPVGGWGTPAHVVLPALTLALPYAAYIARLMRASLLDVMEQGYIRTAIAKGMSPSSVLLRHALRPAILPVVTFVGPLAAHLLTGSVVVETVFNIPGAGTFFVNSIVNRDGFLLGGVVIVYCSLLVVMNTLVDCAYVALDRRVKIEG
ncbi:MAG: ABC transporter permease [Verrucomicrobiia bacterium]